VAELLARPGPRVYGLATAADPAAARARIVAALERAGLRLPPDRLDRLTGLAGDLAAPWLGLRLADYQQLCDELDTVIHAGAGVSWLRGYPDLRPVNVTGTRRVLELAAAGRGIRLVHVSTVAVFPFDRTGPVAEGDPLDHGGALLGGYPQSKWVAERLVAAAAAEGLDAVVVRPGTITGHSRSGDFQPRSFLEAFLATILTTGRAPTATGPGEALVDLTPVDYVAAATAALAAREPATGPYHLVNPEPLPLPSLYDRLGELGYRLRREPYPDWRRRLLEPAVIQGTGLAPFAGYLAAAEERFLRMPVFDATNARRDLAGTGIACPVPDRALLERYLAALHRAGRLPAAPPSPAGRPG
jgi:thioester reductase-like protein